MDKKNLKTFRLKRKLTLAANPFLLDHVIGEHAVLPITCATHWIIQSCAQLYPNHTFFSVCDFKVLKGIVFDGKEPNVYTIDINETTPDEEPNKVCDVLITGENTQNKLLPYYKGTVILSKTIPKSKIISVSSFSSKKSSLDASHLYKDKILFHGPTFQGISKILSLTPDSITFECKLPYVDIRKQGQFHAYICNPFIADVQFQGILVWTTYYHKMSCLPLSYGEFKQFQFMPFDESFYVIIDIQNDVASKIKANVTVCNKTGKIYSVLEDAHLVMNKSLLSLFKQSTLKKTG